MQSSFLRITQTLLHRHILTLIQEVYAFTRAASVAKPQLIDLEKKGVIIRQCDLTAPEDELAEALKGMDIVVSSVGPSDQHIQINIATAAKAAGVKRFIPCGFITVCAPGGIMWLRDEVDFLYLTTIDSLLTASRKKKYTTTSNNSNSPTPSSTSAGGTKSQLRASHPAKSTMP